MTQAVYKSTGGQNATVIPLRKSVPTESVAGGIDFASANLDLDTLIENLRRSIEEQVLAENLAAQLTELRQPDDPFDALYIARLAPDPVSNSDVTRLRRHENITDLSAEIVFEDEWED